jgi:hypothetical protein
MKVHTINEYKKALNKMQERIREAHKSKSGPVPESDYQLVWEAIEELDYFLNTCHCKAKYGESL